MKTAIAKVALLVAWLALYPATAQSQTFTNLHNFDAASDFSELLINGDGAKIYAPLVLSGNTLFGVASVANFNGLGGIFRVDMDGTHFTNIFAFSFVDGFANGNDPVGLTLSGGRLYGVTQSGGSNLTGSIFAINTDGTGFTNLHFFGPVGGSLMTNSGGAFPVARLTLSGNFFYGTTSLGGPFGEGTVFAINTDGSGFTNLFNFSGTNGQNPQGALVVSGNMIYGTTYAGGNSNGLYGVQADDSPVATCGTIFAMNIDGSGFTNLHKFSPLPYFFNMNGGDGGNPRGGLILSDGTLYGTASIGGAVGIGYGTIFALSTDGTGYATIYNFDSAHGSTPLSELLLTNRTLYGTASSGGANNSGSVFSVQFNGKDFEDLYDFPAAGKTGSFTTNSAGAGPWAGLVMEGDALFGVTPAGGTGGVGTVYALTLPTAIVPVPLVIQLLDSNVVLSWTNSAFSLQSASVLGGIFSDVSGATSPYTIAMTNLQQYFRLNAR